MADPRWYQAFQKYPHVWDEMCESPTGQKMKMCLGLKRSFNVDFFLLLSRSKNAASSLWPVNRLRLNQCQQLRLRRQQRPLVLLLLALLKWQQLLKQAMTGDEDVEAQTPRRAKLPPVLPCHYY